MLEILKLIADYGSWVLAAIAVWLGWRRDKNSDLGKLWKELDALRKRQSDVEAMAEHLPSHEDLAELRRGIDSVNTGVATLNGTVTALTQSVNMINQHLLTKSER